MNIRVDDFDSTLKAAIAEAKAVGLEASARRLEERAFLACATSSEFLGQTGAAILEFLRSEGSAVPPGVALKLQRCLGEIRKVWPKL